MVFDRMTDASVVAGPARLALFLPMLEDGGAERVMLQLAASFARRGHDVDLVVAVAGGPLDSQVPPGVRVVELGARRALAALPSLARYLSRERPRALLSTLEHANIMAVWAARLARTDARVVLREASVLLPRDQMKGVGPHVLRALMRRFYRWAHTIVAVSLGVADSLQRGLGLVPERVRTIYNPIVTPELYRKAEAPLDDPWFAAGAPPVIMGMGRLVPAKDFPTLLRAFARVHAQRRARLVILGEGEERARLEALAQGLGVAADVRLAGYDHNPFRYLSRATVFALSSIYEGLPGALIQAMACGCRVISTDYEGGAREIFDGIAAAPLVPPRDPEALARGLGALLDDAARGPARVAYALERFSEAGTVDAYLRVLGVGESG
jgi:glycosyltransferase involved in cell wall biosynthesis